MNCYTLMRLSWRAAALVVLGTFISAAVHAQTASSAPMKLVVPYPAGTSIDVVGRMLADGLAKELGRPVVVDNRAGAAGNIAMEHVATSAPDGTTVLLAVNNMLSVNPSLQANSRVDPYKSLEPVAMILEGNYVLVANPKSPFKDLKTLIALAKANPSTINYSSYGVGSMPHLCAEQMQAMVNIKLVHVPYKSSPINDLVGGNIELGFEPTSAVPFIQSGRLLGLAVTSRSRLGELQTLPALNEAVPGYECVPFVGLLVPAKTAPAFRAALEAATMKVASAPDFSSRLVSHHLVVKLADQESFGLALRRDHTKWSKLIKDLDLKLN